MPATQGGIVNYPFTMGFWRNLQRLQRAIRRHGYEKGLGQDFHKGWGVVHGAHYTGSVLFWGNGQGSELTPSHHHLMKMGAPKEKKVALKSTKEAT